MPAAAITLSPSRAASSPPSNAPRERGQEPQQQYDRSPVVPIEQRLQVDVHQGHHQRDACRTGYAERGEERAHLHVDRVDQPGLGAQLPADEGDGRDTDPDQHRPSPRWQHGGARVRVVQADDGQPKGDREQQPPATSTRTGSCAGSRRDTETCTAIMASTPSGTFIQNTLCATTGR